jgi:beta-glucosidase
VTIGRLREALALGLITESDADSAVRRALLIRFRLGEFDPVAENPYAGITSAVINSPAHQRLALEAARQSIVLLKSECQLLPLNPSVHKTIAVLGPLADRNHLDWYSGKFPYAVTVRDGLTSSFDRVLHTEGVDRIALRYQEKYVTVDANGAHLTDEPGSFDVFDWGNGVLTLRSTATEKFLRVSPEGFLDATSEGPSEWVVREMFRLDQQPDGTVHLVHHTSPGNPSTGSLQENLSMGTQAAGFDIELLIDGTAQAAALAASADAAIVVVGNHPLINGRETEDRANLALPQRQDDLVRAVHAANPSTALLIVSSYPYAAGWAEAHLPAVLWSSHGGQELGRAVAEVLTGQTDPGGRLPQTWYRNDWELPDILDYDIITNDATYLYYRGTPLYPFGHGLSYTTFEYSQLCLSSDYAGAGETVTVSFVVTNTGSRQGTEVVQLYSHQQRSRVKQPLRQLRAFAKLSLASGESREVALPLAVGDLAFWDVTTGGAVLETARHKVMVGRSCTDIRLTATLGVRGKVIGNRKAVEHAIHASDNDEYSGVEPTDTGLRSVEDGAWLLFQGVDLSAANTAHIRGYGGPVEVRADDPFAGPLLAAAPAGTAQRVTTLDGVHDLYLVMQSAGTTVKQLGFTP